MFRRYRWAVLVAALFFLALAVRSLTAIFAAQKRNLFLAIFALIYGIGAIWVVDSRLRLERWSGILFGVSLVLVAVVSAFPALTATGIIPLLGAMTEAGGAVCALLAAFGPLAAKSDEGAAFK